MELKFQPFVFNTLDKLKGNFMGWLSDFVSDPVGTTTDTASNLIGDVGDTLGNVTSDVLGGVRNITGNIAGGLEDLVPGLDLSDPATQALIAGAMGYYGPKMFGAAGAGSEAAGWNAATSGAYGGPETSSALSAGSAGQASNILPEVATGSTGTGLQATGYGSMQGQAAGSSGLMGNSVGYGTGGEGLTMSAPSTAATNPAWSQSVAPAANAPWELSDLTSSLKTGASDLGSTIMNNKLATAMIGSSLYDMYAKNQMAKEQQKRYDQQQAAVGNFYAPGTPEYNQLVEGMKRSAVSAGRPIDSAQFAGDIAAKIADKKLTATSNMAQGQNSLLQSTLGSQYGGLNTLFNNMAMYTLLNKKGLT